MKENKVEAIRRSFVEMVGMLFILLFVYAAVNKLMDVEKFEVQIGQSPLLTGFGWMAWVIPILEILIALMFVIQRLKLLALYLAFSLMVMFTAYIIAILNFSFYVPCSCGGVLEKLGWTEHLIFNIVFVLLAAIAIIISAKKQLAAAQTSVTPNAAVS